MTLWLNPDTGSLFIKTKTGDKYRMIRAGNEWIVTDYFHSSNSAGKLVAVSVRVEREAGQ